MNTLQLSYPNLPQTNRLWLICPSRQTVTPPVGLLKEHLGEKRTSVLTPLVNKNIIINNEDV